jgi:O-antigen ligase
MAPLYAMRLSALWRFFTRQPASFWFISAYLFFEYVRPQQIYEWLPGLPYNKIFLVLAAFALLLDRGKLRWGIAETWLSVFSLVVLISSAGAAYPEVSFDLLSDYFNWVFIYILISNIVISESRFLVFLLGFMVWNFKMSLHGTKSWAQDGFAFRDWGTNGAPGFFSNSGEFGIEMCVFIALLVPWIVSLRPYWSRWKLGVWLFVALTAITGITGSSSRGALLGVAAVALSWLMRTRHKWRGLLLTIAMAGFVYVMMPPEAKARYTSMGEDVTSIQRTTFWAQGLQILNENPAFGVGYKNWVGYHTVRFPDSMHLLPHNIFIEVGSELGYAGLIGFIGLIAATLITNHRTRKLQRDRPDGRFLFEMAHGLDAAMYGYLVAGFFVTVFYYPFFWINLAMTVALHRAALASVSGTGQPAGAAPRGRLAAARPARRSRWES